MKKLSRFKWNSPEHLRSLLCELVGWPSKTLTEGECKFPDKLRNKMMELEYFKRNPSYLTLHDAGLGRQVVTALYKNPKVSDTVVLISHFDTVDTEEYGDLEPYAIQPEQLTSLLKSRIAELPLEAQADLESGDYLFGRGTMDMKAGLAVHMALMEKATLEEWPINLLLLTVPDEEVNSAGMRSAVPELIRLRELNNLNYKLFLNSEPSFPQKPGDPNYYMYTGSIGKIMPAALFYGKETHVGEPMSGLTANFMASFLTQQMEFNANFRESDFGEQTPLPVTLSQKDLKMEYSTQTPYRAAALYNVFLMKQTAMDVMTIFSKVAENAAHACNEAYMRICERERVKPVGTIKVLRYEEILEYAKKKLGKHVVEQLKFTVLQNSNWDDREKSIRLADSLMIQCQELGPAMVLLFAPPYYPAINTSLEPEVMEAVSLLKKTGEEHFNLEINQIHYFNGISDLSYVNYTDLEGWTAFEKNTPVWGDTYHIPFSDMQQLQAPVLNVGPFGKDAHKRTERLHIESAFVQLPFLLETLVRSFEQKNDR